MKYTQIPANTFSQLQLNAGILAKTFTPGTGVVGDLLGATTGGIQFSDVPSYIDFGEDIDNCPKNTKELKQIESREVTMSGTFVTISSEMAKRLSGSADIDSQDATKIVPRDTLNSADFEDLWWIGDYSDKNTGTNAGYIAIHLLNALNTGGFQIQTTDKEKGTFAFTFTGHYSIASQDVVPYELYVKAGTV